MDPLLREALTVLGFTDLSHIPKLKDINKKYRKLALKIHPDRNDGSKESTILFQKLNNAYEVAGKAAENIAPEKEDNEEVIARKMFQQFSFSSVKENCSSFTIITEKSLYPIWCKVLDASFGSPVELNSHGKKFTVVDTCADERSKLYLTLYKTGKVLIQAAGNNHSLNLHFVNHHLEDLYVQVYNRKKLKSLSVAKTPVTKHAKGGKISKTYNCVKCDYQCKELAVFYRHKKKEHAFAGRKLAISTPLIPECEESDLSIPLEEMQEVSTPVVAMPISKIKNKPAETSEISKKMDTLSPAATSSHLECSPQDSSVPTSRTDGLAEFYCMLCASGFCFESDLAAHIKNTHEVCCNRCESTFYDKYDLIVHNHTVHKDPVSSTSQSKPDCEIKCDDCESFFHNNKELREDRENTHVETVNKIDQTEVQNTEETITVFFECDVCQFRANQVIDLHEHKLSHNHSNKCAQCDYESSSLYAYNLHMQDDHEDDASLGNTQSNSMAGAEENKVGEVENDSNAIKKCTICEFTASTEFAFQLHVERKHLSPPI
jgi:hypothetical protein